MAVTLELGDFVFTKFLNSPTFRDMKLAVLFAASIVEVRRDFFGLVFGILSLVLSTENVATLLFLPFFLRIP